MKRIDKVYKTYPDLIIYDIVTRKDISIYDCCPYYADCGNEHLDDKSLTFENGKANGCRGITCKECWDKEFESYTTEDGEYIE